MDEPIQPTPKIDFMGFVKENKWAIVLITASVLAVSFALFLALRKPADNVPTQPKVSISIDAPKEISSGAEVIYKVHVTNSDSSAIKNISVDLVYPNGFSYLDSTPKPTKLNGSQFGIPSLDSKQDAIVMIKGTIQGNAGETKTIAAAMHYRLVNFNSDFVAQAQTQSQITTANVALQFQGETSVSGDQEKTYTINYANYISSPISDFRITLTTPTNYIISKSDPAVAFGTTYTLGSLAPNASGVITLVGTFKNTNTGDQEIFTAKAEGSLDGKPSYALSAGQYQVTIAEAPLQVEVSLDNSDKSGSVAPGTNLRYRVSFKNNGTNPDLGVIVTAKISSDAISLDQISATGANVQGSTITWDASQNPSLESLGAGSSGIFSFNVPVNKPATKLNLKDLTVTVGSEIKSTQYNQPFIGKDLVTKVQTVADISKVVSYSSGQNPPTVGQNTTYMVVIGLKNETSEVDKGKMTFNLPSAINFDKNSINSDELHNITFDKNTRKITWTVDKLAPHAGAYVPQRRLQMSIVIKPGTTDRGGPLALVNNIKFNGTDAFTSQPISISIDPIQTSDEPSGQGNVQ
jgi:hypothetical protein